MRSKERSKSGQTALTLTPNPHRLQNAIAIEKCSLNWRSAAVGEIQGQRAGGAAPAGAHAVTRQQAEVGPLVGGVAGVQEGCDAPLPVQPVVVLRAHRGEIAAADRSRCRR